MKMDSANLFGPRRYRLGKDGRSEPGELPSSAVAVGDQRPMILDVSFGADPRLYQRIAAKEKPRLT